MDKSYQFSENSILKQKLHSRARPYCVKRKKFFLGLCMTPSFVAGNKKAPH